MFTNQQILHAAGIEFKTFANFSEIVCSKANQLFGSYTALKFSRNRYKTFREVKAGHFAAFAETPYSGWEVHHVVEDQDLSRLGIAGQFPEYKQQLCVILPRTAHVHRINNILRNRNPTRYSATASELLPAYREAYELVGNYSGGGELRIRQELLGIVQAAFRLANAR